jgi:hypothetical protein
MDWNQCVQYYLTVILALGGIPEEDRPKRCSNCGQEHRLLHRHGHFPRTVITLITSYVIPIYRFYCPLCESASSVIPDFVEKHHQVDLEMKEQIIEQNENGTSLADLAEQSDVLPGGPYSEKTFWRWTVTWDKRLHQVQPRLWIWLLERLPHFHLWKGQARPGSDWGWFLKLWKHARLLLPTMNSIGFLHFLNRFSRSMALAVEVQNPTKDGHR